MYPQVRQDPIYTVPGVIIPVLLCSNLVGVEEYTRTYPPVAARLNAPLPENRRGGEEGPTVAGVPNS